MSNANTSDAFTPRAQYGHTWDPSPRPPKPERTDNMQVDAKPRIQLLGNARCKHIIKLLDDAPYAHDETGADVLTELLQEAFDLGLAHERKKPESGVQYVYTVRDNDPKQLA